MSFEKTATELAECGAEFYRRGWVYGTSGNFSALTGTDKDRVCITKSGLPKGKLTAGDFLEIDLNGETLRGEGKPSAETLIHLLLYRKGETGAVFHTHSVWGTLLADTSDNPAAIEIEGYEMLKGLSGIRTHEHKEHVPIIENSQDYLALTKELELVLNSNPATHGIYLRRHGLYTWGKDIAEANRHIEIFEALFENVGRLKMVNTRILEERLIMALVHIPKTDVKTDDPHEVTEILRGIGIDYERWDTNGLRVGDEATDEEILAAYKPEVEKLMKDGGYVTADVINITPETPGLEEMLSKFDKEHWHDEDEVRYIVKGHGLFHIAPKEGDVVSIEMEAGDLIRVPRETKHWFNLCADRTVRAIRLFEDPSGWTPHYTKSELENGFQPLCFSAVESGATA